MLLIQYLTTKHDRNGNPRRGWTVHDTGPVTGETMSRDLPITPDYLGWVDEGYEGSRALSAQLKIAYGDSLPATLVMPSYEITPGTYRDLNKGLLFMNYAAMIQRARRA